MCLDKKLNFIHLANKVVSIVFSVMIEGNNKLWFLQKSGPMHTSADIPGNFCLDFLLIIFHYEWSYLEMLYNVNIRLSAGYFT